jgi:hypothetical protein
MTTPHSRRARTAALLAAFAAVSLLSACGGLGSLPSGPDATTQLVPADPAAVVEPPVLDVVEQPVLMCTPPACAPDEVYFCEGDCPGGCGTICVTPSPDGGSAGSSGGGRPANPPVDWDALAVWLTGQWQDNANPAAVRAALQATGVQRDINDWAAADFDGDLRDEWVVVLRDPNAPIAADNNQAGNLWIVNGSGIVYRAYETVGEDAFEFGAPSIVALGDMTGDELPELISNVEVCGAHTCYGNFRVAGFVGDIYADLVQHEPLGEGDPGNTIVLSFPEPRLLDIDQNGQMDLLVHGGTIGSVGAGIVRPRTEIWSWDGTAVRLADTQLDPTEFRHHVLYEANDLMAAGNYDDALLLYEAAINDGGLRTQPFAATEEETDAAIRQFAAFRLILIDIIRGDAERAAARLAWLSETYPDSAAAGAAARVVGSLTDGPELEVVCEEIEADLSAVENPTGPLADMGYGNPSLGAGDFCP